MKKDKAYKIAIWILSVIIVIQGIVIFLISRPKKIPKAPPVIKGKIAIVIDDWGYNLNNITILEKIQYPLTISVLPNLVYSATVAEELHQRGLEIILHLPMQPYEKFKLEKNTIMASMDEQAIRNILKQDLTNIPYVRGVSNHMGSRATEDLKTMEAVFKELKKRHLYFLDSFVSAKSVAHNIARKTHIGFARRDVFLDNQQDSEYIKRQLYKLKIKAQRRGKAVGIGHDKAVTLETLREVMPQLEKEGYRFVFVSELVR